MEICKARYMKDIRNFMWRSVESYLNDSANSYLVTPIRNSTRDSLVGYVWLYTSSVKTYVMKYLKTLYNN
jgi:hypothetical protein